MPYISREERKKMFEQLMEAGKAKIQLKEAQQKIDEEILSKKGEVKTSYDIGSKVRIKSGKYADKLGTIHYCSGGKCVVKVGEEQLFLDCSDLASAAEKPLDEDIPVEASVPENNEQVTVEVDGEVVTDGEPDNAEVEEFGPALAITDMLLQAVNDENTTIQFYNNLIAACNDEGFTAIADVVKHINEEENIHVGMLQYAMQSISEQAKTIDKGTEEAEEIMSGNIDADHEALDASEQSSEETL